MILSARWQTPQDRIRAYQLGRYVAVQSFVPLARLHEIAAVMRTNWAQLALVVPPRSRLAPELAVLLTARLFGSNH